MSFQMLILTIVLCYNTLFGLFVHEYICTLMILEKMRTIIDSQQGSVQECIRCLMISERTNQK